MAECEHCGEPVDYPNEFSEEYVHTATRDRKCADGENVARTPLEARWQTED